MKIKFEDLTPEAQDLVRSICKHRDEKGFGLLVKEADPETLLSVEKFLEQFNKQREDYENMVTIAKSYVGKLFKDVRDELEDDEFAILSEDGKSKSPKPNPSKSRFLFILNDGKITFASVNVGIDL